MPNRGLLITIVNHENTANALSLRRGFEEHAETLLIDSGSALTAEERGRFDLVLPNVYYSGLFNETRRQILSRPDVEIVLFICSDVLIEHHELLVSRLMRAFSDPTIGVYTPSNTGSGHAMCGSKEGSDLRDIPFVDGFILAARSKVFCGIPPVDLEVNPFGWGIDVYAGYLAATMGLRTVVDDKVSVHHPPGSGYDRHFAFHQMLTWLASFQDSSVYYYSLFRRLLRLSRFRLSRVARGFVSPLEMRLFRLIARM